MPAELPLDALNLADFVKLGDTVIWSQGPSEPLSLTELLVRQRREIGRFRAFLGSSYGSTFDVAQTDVIEFFGLGAVGRTRKILEAGALDVMPCHLSQFAAWMRSGNLKIDVALIQVRESDVGSYSYGSVCSYLPDAVRNARVVVAEVNDKAPFTASSAALDPARIDLIIRTSRPLLDVPTRPFNEEDLAIARHVATLVEDGSVLQIGIGTLPDAILSQLHCHKDLGIHSGVIGDGVIGLIESGVVTNSSKSIDAGITVTGSLFGTRKLVDFAHNNNAIRVDPVSYTHDIAILSNFAGFTTINSAIEVDLIGQTNSEVAHGKYVGTIGGQVDFIRGTQAAERGRSIVALSARASREGPGRIVSRLSSGIVTSARADADYVVTEYGVAGLKGRTVKERARQLIAIAHPDDREQLSRTWRDEVSPGLG